MAGLRLVRKPDLTEAGKGVTKVQRRDPSYKSDKWTDIHFVPLQGVDLEAWDLREEVEEARWNRHIHDVMTDRVVIRKERRRHHEHDAGYAAEFMKPEPDGQLRLAMSVWELSQRLRGCIGNLERS